MGRAVVVGISALLGGCLKPSLAPCGDLLCPDDTICLADRGVCASQDAIDVCAGKDDGTACVAPRIDGACDHGLCVASVCGDGLAQGHEQCDGAATLTCADFRFYDGTLTCSPGCLYDTAGCSGRCGDGIVQTEAGEVCDGNQPDRGCADLGYDYGHLVCTALCGDSSLLDCSRYEPDLVFTPGIDDAFDILDAWREGKTLAISRGTNGLVIFDNAVRFDAAGTFGRIARKPGEIAIAHDSGVDLLRGHTLTPLPAAATSEQTTGIAYAPSGNLWAVSAKCEIRELVGTAWHVRAPALDPITCDQLAIDSDGTVYTLERAQQVPEARSLVGGVLTKVSGADSATWLGAGAAGHVIASVQGSPRGLVELAPTRATLVTDSGTYFEGIPLAHGYLVATIELARVEPLVAPLYFRLQRLPLHLRRMADGSVLLWDREITALGALEIGDFNPQSIQGIAHDPAGAWVAWGNGQLSVLGKLVTGYGLPPAVNDVASAGGMIYAITYNELYSGPPGSLVSDATISGYRVWANPAGDVAVLTNSGFLKVRAAGAPSFTTLPAGCADGTSDFAAASLTDIYAVRICGGASVVEHFDGTAWTTLYSTQTPLGRPSILDDGTVAFSGPSVTIGRDTTWVELPIGASTTAGTSATDLWLGNAQTSPAAPAGLVHYNGHTFARVRWPETTPPTMVVTDDQTVLAASYDGFHLIARFEVP